MPHINHVLFGALRATEVLATEHAVSLLNYVCHAVDETLDIDALFPEGREAVLATEMVQVHLFIAKDAVRLVGILSNNFEG